MPFTQSARGAQRARVRTAAGAVSLAALLAWGCGHDPASGARGAGMPPTQVTVLTVAPQTIPAHVRYEGVVEASKHIEVRSLITGVIVARPFTEGTDVQKGTLLYKIDPTSYEAAYRNALGQLQDAKARQANAARNLGRVTPLLAEHAVAQKDVDDAQQAADQANADVASAQGAVDRAQKDLTDTDVRAEVDGRVGLADMVLGARVTDRSDLLTTLDQIDPIYVRFNPTDADILQWRRDIAARRLSVPKKLLRVRVILADGTVVPQIGTLTFADISLQSQTGTQTLRATLANANHILTPGQFVTVEFLDFERDSAILVPQRAVQQGLAGAYVFVVGDSNKVGIRPVQASSWSGDQWVLDNGIVPGDKVIVDGTQKIYPGATVHPIPYNAGGDTAARTVTQDIPAAPAFPLVTGRR
jgi:membrane fusion protein (multidrug efflux system)